MNINCSDIDIVELSSLDHQKTMKSMEIIKKDTVILRGNAPIFKIMPTSNIQSSHPPQGPLPSPALAITIKTWILQSQNTVGDPYEEKLMVLQAYLQLVR